MPNRYITLSALDAASVISHGTCRTAPKSQKRHSGAGSSSSLPKPMRFRFYLKVFGDRLSRSYGKLFHTAGPQKAERRCPK